MGILSGPFRLLAVIIILASCAKNFDSTLKHPPGLQGQTVQETLEGSFLLQDGSSQQLQSLNDKPLLLFFVSETCFSCRQETEHLLEDIRQNGEPSAIRIVSVLIASGPQDIAGWKNTFQPHSIPWVLGSDEDLVLFRLYFANLVTPSTLYYNPSTKILKRWQDIVPIETLKKETGPWH